MHCDIWVILIQFTVEPLQLVQMTGKTFTIDVIIITLIFQFDWFRFCSFDFGSLCFFSLNLSWFDLSCFNFDSFSFLRFNFSRFDFLCFNLDRLCFLSLDFNRFSLCCFNLNWLNFFCSYFRGFCFGSFTLFLKTFFCHDGSPPFVSLSENYNLTNSGLRFWNTV